MEKENQEDHEDNHQHAMKWLVKMVAEDDALQRAKYLRNMLHFYDMIEVNARMYAINRDGRDAWDSSIADQEAD